MKTCNEKEIKKEINKIIFKLEVSSSFIEETMLNLCKFNILLSLNYKEAVGKYYGITKVPFLIPSEDAWDSIKNIFNNYTLNEKSIKSIFLDYKFNKSTLNKNKIKDFLDKENFKLGCYDPGIEIFGIRKLNKILNYFDLGNLYISYKNKKYVLCIDEMGNEIDFALYTLRQYISNFGDEEVTENQEWI